MSGSQSRESMRMYTEMVAKATELRRQGKTLAAEKMKRYIGKPSLFVQECFIWDEAHPGPTEYQKMILDTLPDKKRVCVRGPHGLGKCQMSDSITILANGERVRAGDLVGQSFELLAIDQSDMSVHVAKAFATDNGVKDVVEITTDRGRKIERTLNHPLWGDLTPYRYAKPEYSKRLRPEGGWVAAGDLNPGSVVAISLGHEGDRGYDIPDEEIKLIAYLVGDGSLTGYVRFTQMDGKQLEEFRECCSYFSCELKSYGNYQYAIHENGNSWNHEVTRAVARANLMGSNSWTKEFPEWVWRLDDRQLTLFLSRLYACDGWAHAALRNCGKKWNKEIGYCSVSEQLARDVQMALLRLGIQAELRQKKTSWTHNGIKKTGLAWCVNIHDCENILLFAEKVGIYGKEEAVENVAMVCRNSSDKEQQKWRKWNLPAHMAWERVVSVKLIEAQPTVAITVPGYETFLTDFVEHNTTQAAWLVLYFSLLWDSQGVDWKIVTTASAWRQLTFFLWPEIRKWVGKLRWDRVGRAPFRLHEMQQLTLKLPHGTAFAAASDTPELIEGAHADRILYIFDEAKAIQDRTWDAAEGAFSGAGEDTPNEAYAFAMSTPGEPQGRFYDIQMRKKEYLDWTPIHVTLEMAMKAHRISDKWVSERKAQWGEDSAVFKNRAMGEFAASDEDGVIPASWVENAQLLWKTIHPNLALDLEPMTTIGVDVGDSGPDKTVLAPRYGNVVDTLRVYGKLSPTEVAGYVGGILDAHGGKAIIDGIGVGSGVVSILREQGHDVVSFVASQRATVNGGPATDKTGELKFANKRAHAWWHLRELLDPGNENNPNANLIALPDDDTLFRDLVAPRWKILSDGRILIESKDEIRNRIGRSTDYADAVVQAFYPEDSVREYGLIEPISIMKRSYWNNAP